MWVIVFYSNSHYFYITHRLVKSDSILARHSPAHKGVISRTALLEHGKVHLAMSTTHADSMTNA